MTSIEFLSANPVRRFYAGGLRIAAFRQDPPGLVGAPEDWVGSTTTVWGSSSGDGLSRLRDGELLVDLVKRDPEAVLGAATPGSDAAGVGILVKLLDAGERLPVHVHPDAEFARQHLGWPRGKAEAWVLLDAEPGASVHVGFSRDVDEGVLAEWVAAGDADAMLAAMNEIPVARGDTIYVPPGTPHSIGQGVLILELQESSDLSILIEWQGIVSESEAFLGLPVETGLRSVSRDRVDGGSLAELRSSRGRQLFPSEADRFFVCERIEAGDVAAPGFAIVVGVDGQGAIHAADGADVGIRRGQTVAVLARAGEWGLSGDVCVLACRPGMSPRREGGAPAMNT